MNLLDEMREESDRGPEAHKRLKRILGALSPEDQSQVLKAIGDLTIPASVIARVLQRHGHMISSDSILRYRNQDKS